MTVPLHLEPVGPAHLHAVRRLDAEVYPTPWSEGLWRRELRHGPLERCYVAASMRRRHVGHGGLMVLADEGHVVTVAVDPDHQGGGIGGAVVSALVRRARALGLAALTLEVRAGNHPAQALYRRFGFAPAGARPGYYADNGEDALVMWLHDLQGPDTGRRLDALQAASALDVRCSPALHNLLDHRVDA